MGAEKLDQNHCLHIEMPERLEKNFFSDELVDIPSGTREIIFDFTKCREINRAFYPLLHQFKTKIQKDEIELISTNLCSDLKTSLGSDGVLRIFNFKDDKVAAKRPMRGIDVEFITPFINATTEILKVQANIASVSGKPRVKQAGEKSVYDIIGIISLVSNAFDGSITLCFKQDVFLGICESMLGEKYDEIDDEIEDAAGELLNIIFGVAKAELNDKQSYTIQKAIPTIIRGPGVRIKQTVGPTIILPFETPVGTFQIEIEAADH